METLIPVAAQHYDWLVMRVFHGAAVRAFAPCGCYCTYLGKEGDEVGEIEFDGAAWVILPTCRNNYQKCFFGYEESERQVRDFLANEGRTSDDNYHRASRTEQRLLGGSAEIPASPPKGEAGFASAPDDIDASGGSDG